jgi:hypothetical protein
MWRVIVLASTGCLALGACFPALKVVQPRADFIVRDAAGAAVENAAVTLATFRYPFPFARSTTLATYRTDMTGTVSLRKKRKWLWQVLLPDGVSWYNWAYCVEKPGYRAAAAVEPDFGEPLAVVLEAAAKPSVCEWPGGDEPYHQVEIVESDGRAD